MTKTLKLLYSFFIVFLIAYVSSYFTHIGTNGWYVHANKTIFTPPDSFFPIIWTILYILMAFSYYQILILAKSIETKKAHILFLSQLLLNAVWCLTFFYEKQLGLALIIIFLLDFLVLKTIRIFSKLKPTAGYILYPYFIWLLYASFLNIIFVINNGLIVKF